ncbi:hypothetical protein ACFX2I_029899 [Malus domestica]
MYFVSGNVLKREKKEKNQPTQHKPRAATAKPFPPINQTSRRLAHHTCSFHLSHPLHRSHLSFTRYRRDTDSQV